MPHECDKTPYLDKLQENYLDLKKDVDKLDDSYIDLTKAITKLSGEIETNRYWHKLTVTILTITCTIIFGILQVCLNMM